MGGTDLNEIQEGPVCCTNSARRASAPSGHQESLGGMCVCVCVLVFLFPFKASKKGSLLHVAFTLEVFSLEKVRF